MLLFNLIMLNSIWQKRYLKLDYETQDKIEVFFFVIESLILWAITIFWIIGH